MALEVGIVCECSTQRDGLHGPTVTCLHTAGVFVNIRDMVWAVNAVGIDDFRCDQTGREGGTKVVLVKACH